MSYQRKVNSHQLPCKWHPPTGLHAAINRPFTALSANTMRPTGMSQGRPSAFPESFKLGNFHTPITWLLQDGLNSQDKLWKSCKCHSVPVRACNEVYRKDCTHVKSHASQRTSKPVNNRGPCDLSPLCTDPSIFNPASYRLSSLPICRCELVHNYSFNVAQEAQAKV